MRSIPTLVLSLLLAAMQMQAATLLAQTPDQPAPEKPLPPSPPPSPSPLAPAEQELIYQGEATSILGRQVRGPAGEMVGRIVDVLVGDAGIPRAAVIEFGGFMGLGNRRVAVTWRALRFGPATGQVPITLDMTADQIKEIPEFKRSATPADPPVAVAVPPRPTQPPASAPPASPSPGSAPPGSTPQ